MLGVLPVFALLYKACGRAISGNLRVGGFLLHSYVYAFPCAHSFTVLHALGVLALFRVTSMCDSDVKLALL